MADSALEQAAADHPELVGRAVPVMTACGLDFSRAVKTVYGPALSEETAVGGIVGDEVDGLLHTHTGSEVDKARFNDVRVCGGLAPCRRWVRVGQHEPVRAAGPGVESLESAGHPGGREPGAKRLRFDVARAYDQYREQRRLRLPAPPCGDVGRRFRSVA